MKTNDGAHRPAPPNSDRDCERKEPHPCVPPKSDEHCKCRCPPDSHPQRRPRQPRPARPASDCCEQLLEALAQIPGVKVRSHKPKQKPARKLRTLCETIGVADAIVPALMKMWARFDGKQAPRNSFETNVYGVFKDLGAPYRKAMNAFGERYAEIRRSGKAECLFNDCLADKVDARPLEPSWFISQAQLEGLRFVGQTIFKNSEGILGPGQVRLWDNPFPLVDGTTKAYNGAWPWLTAICPELSSTNEYGTTLSFRPVPPATSHTWENYQYAVECQFDAGDATAKCKRVRPPPGPSGGGIFGGAPANSCEGGQYYEHGGECISI